MIYPQSIKGKFRTIKNYLAGLLLFIYFAGSWIRWERSGDAPNQAIMIDLPNRKGYLFTIEIWPDEAYYVTGLLILAAMGLFFVTSLFGRIWCGYSCPHTIFVDLFVKIETFFQGDRNARVQLDQQPMNKDKLIKKLLTHSAWMLVGFSFAFGWVCYFYNAPMLVHDIVHFQVTSGGLVWLLGLTTSTYLFAGFLREKVCMYMCPYGRFQAAMLDNDSSVVTYHDWRGEPRGKGSDAGDCIDCGKCVVVCPMGIDIRDGLQLSCIGCGLCVDACNTVMDKLARPLGLINYDSVNATSAKKSKLPYHKKIFHFKTILFAAIFSIVASALLYSLLHKEKMKFSIIRDRTALFVTLPNGNIRNEYILRITNKTAINKKLHISSSLPEMLLKTQGFNEYNKAIEIELPADNEVELTLFAIMPSKTSMQNEIEYNFVLKDEVNNSIISRQTSFIAGNK